MCSSIDQIPNQSTSLLQSHSHSQQSQQQNNNKNKPKDYQSIPKQSSQQQQQEPREEEEEEERSNSNPDSEPDSDSDSPRIQHVPISQSFPLPRPKLWPILITFALLDLATSIYFLIDHQPNDIILLNSNRALILDWTFTRAFLVGITSASRRIRTLGWVFASTGMISILLLLWTTNEFVQNNHRPGHTPALPFSLASFLTITILLFFFPLAHWFAFLVAVGITKARNPFVGHSLGLANSARSDYWNWAETNDDGALERVMFLEDEAETNEDEITEEDHQTDTDLTKPNGSQDTESSSSATEITSVITDEEPDRVLISSSPTSTSTTDQEADDQDPDPDEIQDIPPPPITPLTPSRTYHHPIGSSSSCSRANHLRNRNSWLSKQAAMFEEAEERRAQRRSSLPHHRTASCSNGCQTHLPIPDSFRKSPMTTPKKTNSRPVSLVSTR